MGLGDQISHAGSCLGDHIKALYVKTECRRHEAALSSKTLARVRSPVSHLCTLKPKVRHLAGHESALLSEPPGGGEVSYAITLHINAKSGSSSLGATNQLYHRLTSLFLVVTNQLCYRKPLVSVRSLVLYLCTIKPKAQIGTAHDVIYFLHVNLESGYSFSR